MGQILHARATTTHRQRAFIQQSEESIVAVASRLGVNPKTVAKWRQRDFVEDKPMGPRTPRSALTEQIALSKYEKAHINWAFSL